jgi:iron complex outermembrane receptor protein
MRTMLLSILLILFATSIVFSQEMQPQRQDSLQTSQEPKYTLKPIVVTATRCERPIFSVPYAIDLIEKREIQRAEVGLSFDEAMRAIPGVVINNRHNQARGDRIIMRGIGSRAQVGVRGVKIILDGIPLTMPDGMVELGNLDLGSAGRIEILRGPSSSLYGNAAAGLINIQTQFAAPSVFLFQPRFVVGSDGLQKWQGKLSGTLARNSYLINVNKLTLDGYREHSSASSSSLNAVGLHRISDHIRFSAVFNYLYAPYLLNSGSETKTDAMQSPTQTRFSTKQQGCGLSDVRQGQGGISFKYDDGEAHQLEANVYATSYSFLVAIPGKIIHFDWISGGIRTVFSKRFQMRNANLRWTAGTDVETFDNKRAEFRNLGIPSDQVDVASKGDISDLLQYGPRVMDQDETVFGIGPFTQLELLLSSKWVLTCGGRYDHYRFEVDDHFLEDEVDNSGKRNMGRFSPMVGVLYHPHELIKLYGNYSTAFQTPTTTELGNRPERDGGFNPDLNPEIMHSYELGIKGICPTGIKGFGRRLDYDLSLYVLTVEDMLIPFQIQGTEETFYRNAGKAQNKGAEIKLDWFPAQGLQAYFAYTFMDFVFKDFIVETSAGDTTQSIQFAGNEVPGVPPQQILAGMSYQHLIGTYSEINMHWVDQYYTNDYNGPPPGSSKTAWDYVNDSYFVVDARLGFQHQLGRIGIDIFLGINNLFDERYNSSIVPNAFGDRFFEPAPGRNWFSGISVSFPGMM